MSALDEWEPQVIRAFEKDGWRIDQKPFFIRLPPKRNLRADIRFKRHYDQQTQLLIVLEVKCFTDPMADLADFYTAVGQYEVYRSAMRLLGDTNPLYLSIPADAYERFTQHPEISSRLQLLKSNMLL